MVIVSGESVGSVGCVGEVLAAAADVGGPLCASVVSVYFVVFMSCVTAADVCGLLAFGGRCVVGGTVVLLLSSASSDDVTEVLFLDAACPSSVRCVCGGDV